LEVFEYCWNPYTAFQNITNWLKKGGTLYLTLHFVYPLHKPEGNDCLRYTDNWIKKMARLFNYQYLEITERVATKGESLLRQFYTLEEMHTMGKEEVIGSLCKLVK